jgi:hypothetical protein
MNQMLYKIVPEKILGYYLATQFFRSSRRGFHLTFFAVFSKPAVSHYPYRRGLAADEV